MTTDFDNDCARQARLHEQRDRARRWAGVSAIGMALLLLLGAASVTDHVPQSPFAATKTARAG